VINDFLTVIAEHGRIVFGILLLIALSQALINEALKAIFGNRLKPSEYFALGFAGWILPTSVLALLWLFLGRFSTLTIFLLLLILIPTFARLKLDIEPESKKVILSLLTFILLSIPFRLVFVSDALLPSYFDSAQHYLLIRQLLENGSPMETFSVTQYYHPGFHILAAFIVSVLDADISKTILIFGQLTLAIMPISIFFLVKYMTGSNQAGFLAAVLSAFGWYMPAHAVNWGKYPALTSLALLPFVLSLAYLLWQNRDELSPPKRWALYCLFGLSSMIAILIHSRALVVLAIIFFAWGIAIWQGKLSSPSRVLIFITITFVLVLEMLFIQQEALFSLLLDPYINKGVWITVLVLCLSIFAIKEYSQVILACMFSMCFFWGSLFQPVNLPGYRILTLLDRPFVEMILYLPLSVMGGLGLAGLAKVISKIQIGTFSLHQNAGIFVIGLVGVHAFFTYNLYPSKCCVIVSKDDMLAITWIKNHLTREAHIGISGTELDVLTSESPEGIVGGDAGIWIMPLIGRATIPMLYSSDFGQPSVKEVLCQNGIDYLYVGEFGQSFDTRKLNEHPEWYSTILSMQQIKVYEVIGCF